MRIDGNGRVAAPRGAPGDTKAADGKARFSLSLGEEASDATGVRVFSEGEATDSFKLNLVVFFIFAVSNLGGALTPVGDPPLFLGYLKGVHFWWVAQNCWRHWAVMTNRPFAPP